MQETVRAIIINRIPYTDHSSVIRAYTREKGMVSLMAGRMHGKKSSLKSSLLQPLSLLNLVISSPGKGMQNIREAVPVLPMHSLLSDPLKASVGIFLTEILGQTLVESHPDSLTFDFIERSLLQFETSEPCPSDFHISFLWKLTGYIGIGPRNDYDRNENAWFDIVNGSFAASSLQVSIPVDPLYSEWISAFLDESMPVAVSFGMPQAVRRELLHHTVTYYGYHLGWQNGIRSLGVLHEVFEGV